MNTRSLVSRVKKANKNRLYEIFGGSEQSVRLSDELFPKALEVLELLIKHLKANKVEVIVSNECQIYLGYEGGIHTVRYL
jgi:archaeosine-15-forming tRNA-guanine transglycosylase